MCGRYPVVLEARREGSESEGHVLHPSILPELPGSSCPSVQAPHPPSAA